MFSRVFSFTTHEPHYQFTGKETEFVTRQRTQGFEGQEPFLCVFIRVLVTRSELGNPDRGSLLRRRPSLKEISLHELLPVPGPAPPSAPPPFLLLTYRWGDQLDKVSSGGEFRGTGFSHLEKYTSSVWMPFPLPGISAP